MATRIQIRRDTASNWSSANTVLAQGEMALETDTDKVKIGDGSTAWTALDYSLDPVGATGRVTGTDASNVSTKLFSPTANVVMEPGTGGSVVSNGNMTVNGTFVATDMGTFTGSVVTDNQTLHNVIQQLETAVEAAEESSEFAGLAGVGVADTHLGTFTGTTVSDNGSIKAGMQALETAVETKLASADIPTKATLDVDHLITLSGMADASDNLGTFTGSTIADNGTIKAGMQALETAVESAEESTNIAVNQDNINDLNSSVGTTLGDTHVGTFTGSTITDNQSVKAGMQELETKVEVNDDNIDDINQTVGVALGAQHVGTFSGSTITDNSTVKTALQALETAVEASEESPAIAVNTDNINDLNSAVGTTLGDQNIGTFSGSTISDNGTIKAGMQELETAVEAAEETTAIAVNTDNISDLNTAVGTGVGWQHIQTFTGSTISDNGTVKAGMQELETAVETKLNASAIPTKATLDVDHLITLTGVADASDHLSTFTGSTITDNSTVKVALQELEVAVEAAEETAAELHVDDLISLSGVGQGETHMSTFTGSTITDNQTVKASLQALETSLETKTTSVLDDTSPQLGADLDINTHKIVSTSDGDIVVEPDGTGRLKANTDVTVTGDATVGGNMTIDGNLLVNGSNTIVNATVMTVDDPLISLGGDTAPTSDDNKDRGVEMRWHDGTNAKLAFMGYDDSEASFVMITDATNTGEVMSGDHGPLKTGAITANGTVAATGVTIGGTTVKTVATSGSYADLSNTPTKATYDVDHLISLSGVTDASDNLGTFTGSTIADNRNVKQALQALETGQETKLDASSIPTKASLDVDHLITLSGVTDASDNLGTFSGSTVSDNGTVKAGMQELETAVETKLNSSAIPTKASLDVDHLITLSGVTDASDHLGTFSGSTITDNDTIKDALQALETAVEAAEESQADLDIDHLVTLTGVATASDHLGTFTGSTVSDNGTIKAGMQELETAVESSGTSAAISAVYTGALGLSNASANYGTFTGSTITDNGDSKEIFQELETAVETKLATSAHTQASLDVDHLVTLTGVATASDNLGAFSGSTIADDQTVKASLQALETAVETKAADVDLDDLITLSGVIQGDGTPSVHLSTFTGSTISNNGTIKEGMQDLETAVETKLDASSIPTKASLDVDHLITLSGVTDASDNLGSFAGSTISDNQTIKVALQSLESAVEAAEETSAINGVYTGALGLGAGDAHYGTFTGSTITDNGDSKEILQELETAVETKLATSAHTKASLDVDHLITLSGVADAANHLGTFSGSTISNSQTVKQALQALETAVEAAEETAAEFNVDHIITLTGVAAESDNLGAFTGSTIADNQTIKASLQALETAVEAAEESQADLDIDHLVTLTGVSTASDDLGTFTGSTIADNETIKGALQDLETKIALVEVTIPSNAVHANYTAASTLTGVVGDDDLGTFTGSAIADNETIKGALQDLEDAIPTKASLDVDHLITISGVSAASDHLGTFTGSTISDNGTIKAGIQELETAVETKAPSSAPTLDGKVTITNATSHIQFPSWTSTERDNGSFSAGAVIFNSTTSTLQVNDGSNWVDLH